MKPHLLGTISRRSGLFRGISNRNNWRACCSLAVSLALGIGSPCINAAVVSGLAPGDFINPVVENFERSNISGDIGATVFDYGNGMLFRTVSGAPAFVLSHEPDLWNLSNDSGNISGDGGRDGPTDGFFFSNSPVMSFQLEFAAPITSFGFYGAETQSPNISIENDGIITLEFYNQSDALVGTASVDTSLAFPWQQFFGFTGTDTFSRVVFRDIGLMLMDDVHFSPVPIPPALWLFGSGLLGLVGMARRKKRA